MVALYPKFFRQVRLTLNRVEIKNIKKTGFLLLFIRLIEHFLILFMKIIKYIIMSYAKIGGNYLTIARLRSRAGGN